MTNHPKGTDDAIEDLELEPGYANGSSGRFLDDVINSILKTQAEQHQKIVRNLG